NESDEYDDYCVGDGESVKGAPRKYNRDIRELEILIQSVNSIEPFKIEFQELDYFLFGKSSSTVWLKPKTEPNVEKKEKESNFGFQEFDDLIKVGSKGFEPHLSLAQEAIKKFSKIFSNEPIKFELKEIYWITREGYNDPFKIFAKIGLGKDGIA
ncbi:9564_t:CDS:2, partial [Dentiscutata erythropus]